MSLKSLLFVGIRYVQEVLHMNAPIKVYCFSKGGNLALAADDSLDQDFDPIRELDRLADQKPNKTITKKEEK
jgi:hypothetical protein